MYLRDTRSVGNEHKKLYGVMEYGYGVMEYGLFIFLYGVMFFL